MSNNEDKVITIRGDIETDKSLERCCERSGLKKGELLKTVVKIAEEFRVWELDWKDRVLEDRLEYYNAKVKTDLRKEIVMHDLREGSKQKDRDITYQIHFEKLIWQTMTDKQKQALIESKLQYGKALRGERLDALPEKLEDGRAYVLINGKRVIVDKFTMEGFPVLAYNQERLVRCEGGFHTKGSWCSDCDKLTTCFLLRDERIEGMK